MYTDRVIAEKCWELFLPIGTQYKVIFGVILGSNIYIIIYYMGMYSTKKVMRENEDVVDWQLSSLRLTCYSFMGVHFPRHLTPYAGTTEVGNQAVSQETTLETEKDSLTNI